MAEWQTRLVEGQVRVISWGFNSPRPHHTKDTQPAGTAASVGASRLPVRCPAGMGGSDHPQRRTGHNSRSGTAYFGNSGLSVTKAACTQPFPKHRRSGSGTGMKRGSCVYSFVG